MYAMMKLRMFKEALDELATFGESHFPALSWCLPHGYGLIHAAFMLVTD
jgi:hypothetical protein